ncbi:MAG: hypothetical protein GU356_10780 [Pyrobaculum sp.]|nr:hypothetical protein [Pyrobaculum sp.]
MRWLISTCSIRYPPQPPPFTSLFHIYADPTPELPRPVALKLGVVERCGRWRP